MSAFPCEDCGALNEMNIFGSTSCKKCQSKKPFKCSKCGKRISVSSVFHPEKLTMASKPIFCIDCGSAVEQVECRHCGITLMRSTGIEVPINGVLRVYHKNCYEKQKSIHKWVLPIALCVCTLFLGYLGITVADKFDPGNTIARILIGLVGAGLGAFLGKKIAGVFALK